MYAREIRSKLRFAYEFQLILLVVRATSERHVIVDVSAHFTGQHGPMNVFGILDARHREGLPNMVLVGQRQVNRELDIESQNQVTPLSRILENRHAFAPHALRVIRSAKCDTSAAI